MRNVRHLLLSVLLLLFSVMIVACGAPEPQAVPTKAPAPTEAPAEEAPAEEEPAPTEAPAEEEPAEEAADALEEITVAYFLEWPTANQVAQLEETYDEVMGVKVNWVSFDTGVAMSAAMASGDVHIAYSQGLVPFANAVTAGVPLQMVGVALSYADNDNCVAATSAGITADNATDLEGQKVAVPIGTVAHYKMLRQMEHLGVDVAALELVDLAPADGAAALQRGDVAMACGWGGALRRMLENGNILMTGAETEAIGVRVFDVVSVTDDFANDHPDLVTAFMQVTEDANAAYTADPTANQELIADAAGMEVEDSNAVLDLFTFPSSEAQLSDAWMGGTVQTFIKEVADFFVEQGELDASLDSYDQFINTSFLEQVQPASWPDTAASGGDAMASSEKPDEITVAYFLEWPTANQVAQLEETYDEVMGVKVNWVSFDTGVAMSAAMASGDVHIAYSQGLVPFANAVTAGVPLKMVGVAVSYAENDNCVAATSAGITADNATDLEGQKVAVPIGTVAHYKMLRQMEHLGVDIAALELVDLAPADGAAALQRGDVAMACGWGGALRRMKENGNILMTGAETEAIGVRVFDVVSVTDDFAAKHPDLVTAFMQVTEDSNAAYAADPTANQELIADAAGMTVEDSNAVLDLFGFPSSEEQLSDAWMGGTVQSFIKEVADFFVEQGELEASLDSYDQFIDASFLEAVAPAEWPDMAMEEEAMEEEPAEEDAMASTEKPEEITVAYFLEWPTANQVAQLEETYDEVMGVKVNWVSFDTGVAMSAAMASGDVHIAYSQGLVPFANAVTAGVPLKMVGVAVSYADNDNCVAATSAGITADNATDLEGQKVAVPIGTVAHYKMLRQMEHLGVDIAALELVDLAPADGAAALQRGDVAMACGWGGALRRMKENGNILMTGAETEAIGVRVFDVVSVTDDFAAKHPDLVTAFMQVTEDSNAAYAADPTANQELIADAAGMELEDSNAVLDLFTFPSSEAQLSDDWMGGTVQTFIKEVADFFVVQGELEESLDSYDSFVDSSFLEQVTPAEWPEAAAEASTDAPAMDEGEKPDEITVAYFLEWPTANQVAQLEETYDEVMGVKVNWVSFDTGVAMSAAMASGDVHIAYSQGLVPFANAVTAGVPLKMVGVAVSYADNDNCVAATDAGITADNATDLEGQKVAVPIGTVAHYKMLRQMEHLGVDIAALELVDLAPADGAAALQRGDVAMACGWGGALRRMKENGNILMTGAETEAIGVRVFDVVSVTDDFASQYPSLVTAFMQVTEDSNAAYAADPTANQELIADAAGMELEDSNAVLDLFSFPSSEEQLSDAWMGGTVQTFIKEVADFFVEQGELEESLDSYDGFVDTSFLEQVQ